ncbi:unnamed protein product [Caenorhabditis sp. 36 PRJEB53466]|nr:unnamed protein product [Caenorhabditis sp. 36 PRJEB53466]
MNINLTFINSTFVNLENLSRDTSISIGKGITVCSVIMNALAIFLIVTKSRKETKAYKTALVTAHSLLCLAQFQWGFLMCIVPLFPFPAFIFYGVLSSFIDVILLIQVWIFIIVSFLWTLFGTLVIRLRMVVRRNSFTNFSSRTYYIVSISSYLFCVITVVILFEVLRKPPEEIEAFIAWKYPKYSNVSRDNYLLVVSDKTTLHISALSCILIAAALVACYITLSISIFVEVRHRVNSMSAALQRYHLKVLKDIVLQIIIKLVTFTFYPILIVSLYYVSPEYNCINLTMLLYNVFVAAPIPGTVVLIVQTPSYRQFLFKTFTRVKAVEPVFILNHRSSSFLFS